MKQGRTELIFILDRSGSMGGLEPDTIGGYNGLLKKQREETGECTLTTVLFDDRYEVLHDREDIRHIRPLTEKDYYVRGTTALLDAIGRTLSRFGSLQKVLSDKQRADKVMVVIITDGMENASTEYNLTQVRHMVSRQRDRFGWEILFLGANIDAIGTAAKMGIHADRAVNYHADKQGTQLNYDSVGDAVRTIRAGQALDADWKNRIDHDYHQRGGK